MGKRINPFVRGEPEHSLFASWRRNTLEAERLGNEAALIATDANAAHARRSKLLVDHDRRHRRQPVELVDVTPRRNALKQNRRR